jgi:hypothetical protein
MFDQFSSRQVQLIFGAENFRDAGDNPWWFQVGSKLE